MLDVLADAGIGILAYSRMLLGFFITFEPPSLYSVLATLKRVNRHKGYVQKLYPQIKAPRSTTRRRTPLNTKRFAKGCSAPSTRAWSISAF
ncbi:hypothetical protein [Bradyrhizobium sp. CCBAU 051011]|uniref:hypothetical protein n=1 Tax=Bradyrhizobium sp. CCBAU 051011 TaxID=858422 RepID=UPI00137A17EA|nr:hypothetical protein [Bradyrhizobium sp. CCBAU 051011]